MRNVSGSYGVGGGDAGEGWQTRASVGVAGRGWRSELADRGISFLVLSVRSSCRAELSRRSRAQQPLDVTAELANRAVETGDVAVGARDPHPTPHGRQHA